jgi:methionyl-tRNA formyltransferase
MTARCRVTRGAFHQLALMAGERTHGVSWHVMTDKADAGDVLNRNCFLSPG